MAMVSATMPGTPQAGSSHRANPGAPMIYNPTDGSAPSNTPIRLQERSFYYQHFRPTQIRPQRSPLYVPAVFRPTEGSARQPSTPPSVETSFDTSQSPTVQRASGDASGLARIVTDEWDEAALGKVTGLPTKNHWKPDASTESCDLKSCTKQFTFFNRRHHCRRCGNIFCGDHSHYMVPLDQHARFHPSGSRQRACDRCWADYKMWENAKLIRTDSTGSMGSGGSPRPMAVGTPNTNTQRFEGIAESAPREWNWSTF